ncbi:MAG: DNA mismatch repair endonuclease MutL, partial [Eubacteriaceae bacterium]|nr:DNA mismatch repair endonuclease MutL [Eubacteriaceae bacterium]
EVVTSPASVVKEMLENSIDAKSTVIKVTTLEGGKKLIKVADNGTGIMKDDLPKVFMRSATSKIKDDISSISSLGFRGEALASISYVSKIKLTTRTEKDETGFTCEVIANEIISQKSVACNVGTTIEASDLFYNLPARLKHLSSDSRQTEAVTDIAGKIALSRTDIAFELNCNSKTVFSTPGDGNIKNTCACIMGRGTVSGMMEIQFSDSPLYVKGLISSPAFLKEKSSRQITILNGRYVECEQISKAVETVYNELYGRRGADFILFVTLPFEMTDVNIHPAKTSIRLLNESLITMLIKQGLRNSLREQFVIKQPALPEKPIRETPDSNYQPLVFEAAKEYLPDNISTRPREISDVVVNKPISEGESDGAVSETAVSNGQVSSPLIDKSILLKLSNMEVIGNAFGLYALIECGDELYAMDTHAAHERVLYDKYLKAFNERSIVKQELLLPQVTELSASQHSLAMENIALFDEIGFSVEDFGGNYISVRSIPAYLSDRSVTPLIEELIEQLTELKSAQDMRNRNELLIKRACHDAVRGRENISADQSRALLRALYETDMPFTCPHGRPILGKIDEKYFMRVFERIK